MNKWKNRYSVIAGIFYIVLFIARELLTYFEILQVVYHPLYIVLILLNIAIFLGYIRYSYLNERKGLYYTTIMLLSSYALYLSLEYLDKMFMIEISSSTVYSASIIVGLSMFVWSIMIILQKRIYGNSTFILGLLGIVFAASFFVNILRHFNFPIFLIFYIVVLLPFKKKKDKKKEPRLLWS